MRPPRNEPRPSASRMAARYNASRRRANAPRVSISPDASRSTSDSSTLSGHRVEASTSRPSLSWTTPASSSLEIITSSPVARSVALEPGLKLSGRSASESVASVRTVSVSGKRTVTLRTSTDFTRPGPRSGLWRWVRRSPVFHRDSFMVLHHATPRRCELSRAGSGAECSPVGVARGTE